MIRELLGHRDVRTTMIYTHVLNRGALGVGARWMGYRDRAGGGVGTGAPATAGGRGRKCSGRGRMAPRAAVLGLREIQRRRIPGEFDPTQGRGMAIWSLVISIMVLDFGAMSALSGLFAGSSNPAHLSIHSVEEAQNICLKESESYAEDKIEEKLDAGTIRDGACGRAKVRVLQKLGDGTVLAEATVGSHTVNINVGNVGPPFVEKDKTYKGGPTRTSSRTRWERGWGDVGTAARREQTGETLMYDAH